MIAKRLNYNEEDVKEFLNGENLFKNDKMDFDSFKKVFFPQLFHVTEANDSDNDEENLKKFKNNKKEDNQQIIMSRLSKMEHLIKERFANNWVSVRKAFLDLD